MSAWFVVKTLGYQVGAIIATIAILWGASESPWLRGFASFYIAVAGVVMALAIIRDKQEGRA